MNIDRSSQSHVTYSNDNEIDFFRLFENLWSQRLTIILTTLLTVTVGISYAFLTKPIYESNAFLLPPLDKDVVELRKLEGTWAGKDKLIALYTNKRVYQQFVEILTAYKTKRLFFHRPEIYKYFLDLNGSEVSAWNHFEESLNVSIPTISLQTDSAKNSAQWLNDYIDHTIDLTREFLVKDLEAEMLFLKNKLTLHINTRFQLFNTELEKEIQKLHEALNIANKLNLKSPLKIDTVAVLNENDEFMVDDIRRLYKLGSNALRAEISALEARKDKGDVFISEFTQLKLSKTLLDSIKINPDKIHPVRIDLSAQVSERPIKPKKVLILVISAVLGVMLGVMIALIKLAVFNRKNSLAQNN